MWLSETNLEKDHVDHHQGWASFVDANTVQIEPSNGDKYTVKAKHIVIAVGGRPTVPSEQKIPGASYGITSDEFFELETQPKRVAVVGAGYIAVELAGVFNTLGSETHLVIRHNQLLRSFDPMMSEVLVPCMGMFFVNKSLYESETNHLLEKAGMKIHKKTHVKKVEKTSSGSLLVHFDSSPEPIEVDCLVWAIGRHADTAKLGLDKAGVKYDKKGDVIVDDYQNTNVPGIYAVGDVGGKMLLTPVAIAAGRRLSNRLFGPEKFKNDKLSYDNIPSVVFS